MRPSKRDLAVLTTSFVAASAISWLAHWLLARFVIHDVTYRIVGGWLYWPFLFGWVVDAVLFGATGFALAVSLDAPRRELWALLVGALYSLALLAMSPVPVWGDVPMAVYFWVYGAYLVPPFAGWLAAAYCKHAEHQMRYPA